MLTAVEVAKRLTSSCQSYRCTMLMTSSRHKSDDAKRRRKELRKMKEKLKVERIIELNQKEMKNKKPKVNKFEVVYYPKQIAKGEKKDTTVPMPLRYAPEFVEAHWYDWWEKEGLFNSWTDDKSGRPVWSMVIPPPNVTGRLHMGHALTVTIEDIIARWKRMSGYDVMWLPGSDHAGIATQVVVEKFMRREFGESKMSRTQLTQAMWKWKEKKGVEIYDQLRRMGASLDWKRECFTLDEKYHEAVVEAFVRLHQDGLIERSEKMINWSPHLTSSISDIEVESRTIDRPVSVMVPGYSAPVQFGVLHKLAYKLHEGVDGIDEIVVATSRPETLMGDVAVGVNPNDDRYASVIGRQLIHPFLPDRRVIVLADDAVDPDKGTGAVKITPCHDRLDFEIGSRHGLDKKEGVDEQGRIVIGSSSPSHELSKLMGVKQFEARQKIIDLLIDKQLYRGSDNYQAVIKLCSRTGDVIEPRIKRQWFVKVTEMCSEAISAVDEGRIELVNGRLEKLWRQWLTNTQDWCLSRSLNWGHRIPAYKITSARDNKSTWVVARSKDEAVKKCGLGESGITSIQQDPDVLDTWFSSAIFPFAPFGWPNDKKQVEKYYPLDIMETGHDLIFFWVARMVMLGIHLTQQVPFKKVLFHPMVCDNMGRKMSKSLGNVIDPMHVIQGCSIKDIEEQVGGMCLSEQETKVALSQAGTMEASGSDALRMSLCHHHLHKDTIRYQTQEAFNSRKILNKIWQSFRLTLFLTQDDVILRDMLERDPSSLMTSHDDDDDVDVWMRCELLDVMRSCEEHLISQNFSLYASNLIRFFTNQLSSIYQQTCKGRLISSIDDDGVRCYKCDDVRGARIQYNLLLAINISLRLLHPIAPFITEELWQRLPLTSHVLRHHHHDVTPSICTAPFPQPQQYAHLSADDSSAPSRVRLALQLVALYRSMRDLNTIELMGDHLVAVSCRDEVTLEVMRGQRPLVKLLLPNLDYVIISHADVTNRHVGLIDEAKPISIFFKPHDMKKFATEDNLAVLQKRLDKAKDKNRDEWMIKWLQAQVDQIKLHL